MPDAATETFNAKRASLVYTLKDINGSTLAALVVSVVPGRAGNPCLNNACVVRECRIRADQAHICKCYFSSGSSDVCIDL